MRRCPDSLCYALVALGLGSALACGPAIEGTITHPVGGFAGCMSATNPQGVDVSTYNGQIDWATVAGNGIAFGIAKATEGLTIQDDQFAANWSGMSQAGVVRGAYHFFHPGDDGTQQADAFLAMTGTLGSGDLPPFLDWEVIDSSTVAASIASAQAFIAEIAAKTGLTTVIYTYPDFWTSTLGNPSEFAAYPVWFANYGVTCPAIPAPWTSWLFWQYSASGAVNGIPTSSAVDLDVFNGTLAELQALAGDGGTVTPPTDAGPGLLAQVSGNDALTLVNWPDSHMELFAKTPAGAAMHAATTGTGDSWSTFAQLDTGAECGSAAAFWGEPWVYPELFSPITGGTTSHLWWTAGTGWNTYQMFGGTSLSHLSTLTWADGHVSAFALGSDGTIWENDWSTTASNWTGWSSIGGANLATGAGTVMTPQDVGQLFATDSSGDVWTTTSGTNGWGTWTKVTGATIASRPFPVRWADGHVSVYARGTDDLLYFADFSASSPALAPVDSQTEVAGDPSAFVTPSGPTLVTRLLSGQVVQSTWMGTGYSQLAPLGVQVSASDPFAWLRGDGNGEVFAVDPTGAVMHSLQSPSAGWQGWNQIGTGIDACSTVVLQTDDAGVADGGQDGGPDAGPDAGADGGQDAGMTMRDGGGGPGSPDGGLPLTPGGGCGCASGAGSPLAALVLAVLVGLWRRTPRSSRRP